MPLILGIDPGSRKTGYGVISVLAGRTEYVASGVIRIPEILELAERLHLIYRHVGEIIDRYQPQQMAVEQVFMAKNASSALKLGQARGAAIVAGASRALPVHEYAARKVKQAVVGNGAADKWQVQQMIKTLLKLDGCPQEDAADALAVALCHAHTAAHLERVVSARQYRRGRLV